MRGPVISNDRNKQTPMRDRAPQNPAALGVIRVLYPNYRSSSSTQPQYMEFIPTPRFSNQWCMFKLCFWTILINAFWKCNDLRTSNDLMTWWPCIVLFWLCNDLWSFIVWLLMVFSTILVYVFFTFYIVEQMYALRIKVISAVKIQGLIWWYFY